MDQNELDKKLEEIDKFCALSVIGYSGHRSEYNSGVITGVTFLKVYIDELFNRQHQFEGYSLDTKITIEEVNRDKILEMLMDEISLETVWNYTRRCKSLKDFKYQISLLKSVPRG